MVPYAEIGFDALFVQAILYGLYLATFVHSLRWLLFKDEGWTLKGHIDWLILFTTVSLFVISTADIAISFITTRSAQPGNIPLYDLAVNTAAEIIECLAAVLVDGILIYRCWMIYARSWVIIAIPLILWLGEIPCMILGIHLPGQTSYIALMSFYCCVIATNLYATSAIVLRIWRATKESGDTKDDLRFTMRIIIDSGLLLVLTNLALLIAFIFVPRTPYAQAPQVIISAINFPMSGITFNLVTIRVAQQRVMRNTEHNGRRQSLSTLHFKVPTNPGNGFKSHYIGNPDTAQTGSGSISEDVESGK
ncbi:hypothetical protein AMATHDRAFT_85447 [Amanita thiersii Skay4041]|uniref:G-protein coupled receptors family 1 profile domain-containing protein n=1 Tax=Amanita thiersii Skay4041 TaxID=703135 RepID=A0A2A9NLL5_9AGAR|nr:hypothetical protein AMATHDRAFT_85447 [Amanita thiersii Skay4041]